MENKWVRFEPKKAKCLARLVKEGKLVRYERGIYGPREDADPLSIVSLRYPEAIVTLMTALSLYHLSDEQVEAPFDLAFRHGHRPIKNPAVRSFDVQPCYFSIGKSELRRDDGTLSIYDPERLLIEVFIHEKELGVPRFSDVIQHYRVYVAEGKFFYPRFEEHCHQFKRGAGYLKRFQKEVE